jgi:hypothetical protein
LEGLDRKRKSQILLRASAICWALWFTPNDVVFDNATIPSYMQVIFKETYYQILDFTSERGSPTYEGGL